MSKFAIGIFQGKKAKNNTAILKTLYDCGPLTLWGIAKQIRKAAKPGKVSKSLEYGSTQIIQSVVSKRLKDLERKGYLKKLDNRQWILNFKGIVAVLINEPRPRAPATSWLHEWIQTFMLPSLKKHPQGFKYKTKDVNIEVSAEGSQVFWQNLHDALKDFNAWLNLAEASKSMVQQGVINIDLISNELFATILLWQDQTSIGDDFQSIVENLTKGGENSE